MTEDTFKITDTPDGALPFLLFMHIHTFQFPTSYKQSNTNETLII